MGGGPPRPFGKAAISVKKLAGLLLTAVLLALPVRAAEPVIRPIGGSTYAYTYYAIDADGNLYAWGDSFHGAVGPTDQDPLPWEEANILLDNARCVTGGFVMAAAVDTDGVLWGWGGHAGRTFGEEEPYRLLEDTAEVSIGDTQCTALRTDGTVWVWGARSGASLKEHSNDPFFRPVQVLDHAARLEGNMAVLEDGTLVHFQYDGDTVTTRPLMEQVADVRTWSGFDDSAYILVQGEDGSLWRVPRVTVSEGDAAYYVLGQPEKFLEDVVQFTSGAAVTADGTLWAWGRSRPAMLDGGTVDPADPYDPADCEAIVPILEGVRWAEPSGNSTLAVLKDGSLWELPLARTFRPEMEGTSLLREPRQLLDRVLLPGDPPEWPEEAPVPTVLPSASLEAWEAGQTDKTGSAAPEAQPEPLPEPAATVHSPAAALAAVAASAAALALIGWLRNRKH